MFVVHLKYKLYFVQGILSSQSFQWMSKMHRFRSSQVTLLMKNLGHGLQGRISENKINNSLSPSAG